MQQNLLAKPKQKAKASHDQYDDRHISPRIVGVYRDDDFAAAIALLTNGKAGGEGWAEIRALDDGAEAFVDIDQGRAHPRLSFQIFEREPK